MADRFRELLKTRDYIIFDGAMGTMLQAAGMKMGETPEVLNITRPELLVSIAGQYYNAGRLRCGICQYIWCKQI